MGLQVDSVYLSRNFADFLREAWHVIEPSTALEWGPHLDAICLHLEAVARSLDRIWNAGDVIRNLVVTIPPGCTKSITIMVAFPAWVWTWRPGTRFLCASNDADLAIRDAVACRRLIESDWYKERWAHVFQLTSDQNTKGWYENSRRGYRSTTTVGSKVVGKKGDILLVDDPNDANQVKSLANRKSVVEWWGQGFYNRVNNPKKGCRIVVGQRTHVDDLQGNIINGGKFVHLNLPEEYDPARHCKTPIWEDWRTEAGQLLRPDRFGPDQITETKHPSVLGARGYESQHNQNPRLADGDKFKREWFKIVKAGPALNFSRVRAWDNAGTARKEGKKADYSAGALMTRNDDDIFYIEHVERGQWPGNERNKIRDQKCQLDSAKFKRYEVVIEQEPSSSGKEVAEQAVKMLAGYSVTIVKPSNQTGGKDVRCDPLADQLEAGNVYLVEGDWNTDFIDELCDFGPGCMNDDQVDAAAMAMNHLALHKKRSVWIV